MQEIKISIFRFPCTLPESDGTLKWNSTTLIAVTLKSDHYNGIGFTYGHEASASVIKKFADILKSSSVLNIPWINKKMIETVRNSGLYGIAAHAISAVDMALWDLKAKVLQIPLCELFGMVHQKIPVYGSGGFTSYSTKQILSQFENWKKSGIKMFKMKVGRCPSEDVSRVQEVRKELDESDELFVDANGAYACKESLYFAKKFLDLGVSWFEEPVSSDDLEGLRFLRNHTKLNIAAGEYGYDLFYFIKMLQAGSVDILQADATRCCGYTGFLEAGTLSKAFHIPLSSHTAPSFHLPVCLSLTNFCHMEFFHDHVEIEKEIFEGLPVLKDGYLIPHLDRFGHGLEIKAAEVKKYLIKEEFI